MTNTDAMASDEAGRTPSMFASLAVFGVMIGLILLSVVFFGEEVAAGPLQVSITLVTIVLGFVYSNKKTLPKSADAETIYG